MVCRARKTQAAPNGRALNRGDYRFLSPKDTGCFSVEIASLGVELFLSPGFPDREVGAGAEMFTPGTQHNGTAGIVVVQ